MSDPSPPSEAPSEEAAGDTSASTATHKRVPVINGYCVGCGDCVDVCPEGSLRTILDAANLYTPDTCISCEACIPVCDDDAIHMKWVEMDGRQEVGDWTDSPPEEQKGGWLKKLFGKG